MASERRRRRLLSAAVVVTLVAAASYYVFGSYLRDDDLQETALFVSAKGIYVGDDVRILGVKVGSVDSITPTGDGARVTFSIDRTYPVPADAEVALVAPSIVASRYLQLAPAYTGGPTLADHQVIPRSRTAVPLEFDDVKVQLTKLSTALSAAGANSAGALNRLLVTADKNLSGGNAQLLHDTLTRLPAAVAALNNSKGDLFATIQNLNSFIANLNDNDVALRRFSSELDGASAVLDSDRQELAVALYSTRTALADVISFVTKNRAAVKQSTVSLTQLSQTLAYSAKGLAALLHVAPTAIDNFYNIIDPRYNALTGRFALTNFGGSPASLLCGALASLGPVSAFQSACTAAVTPLAELLGIAKGLPGVPGPTGKNSSAAAAAAALTAATPGAPTPGVTTTPLPTTPLTGAVSGAEGLLGLLLPGTGGS